LVSLRNLPYVTFGLVVLSGIVFVLVPDPVTFWKSLNPIQKGVIVLMHPVFHQGTRHLAGNIMGLLVTGSLVEIWMTPFARRVRYMALVCCYLASLAVSAVAWIAGMFALGLSGMIFGELGVSIVYYSDYFQKPQLDFWDKLAPVCMGIIFAFLIAPLLYSSLPLEMLLGLYLMSEWPHLAPLVLCLVSGNALLSRATPTKVV
jgi:membrane associated rhomboid family serine protease